MMSPIAPLWIFHRTRGWRRSSARRSRPRARVFLLRLFHAFHHRAQAGAIDGHGLFAEDMLAGVDGGLDVHRTEAGRGGENHHVHAAVDDLLVGVEADKFPLFGDINFVGLVFENGFEGIEAGIDFVAEDFAHGPEDDVAVAAEGLVGRAGAAAAAADETDLEFVAGVGRARQAREGEGAAECAAGEDGGGGGGFEESPAGSGAGRRGVRIHRWRI